MPNKKITELDELLTVDVSDLLAIVDISEVDATLRNKKVTVANLTSLVSSPVTTKGDLVTYDTSATRLPVGTDGQLLVANSATAEGIEWQTVALGEPYVEINSTGAVPVANATDMITIGEGVVGDVNSTNSIIIGKDASITDAFGFNDNTVVLGPNATADASESVSIGSNSDVSGATTIQGGISILGSVNEAGCIAIGYGAGSSQGDGISIGRGATTTADDSIAIGENPLVESGSLRAIAIGRNATVGSGYQPALDSIAIGNGALIDGADMDAIAIGKTAVAQADGAVQLGTGSNGNANTLNFLTNRIANDEGIEAPVFAGVPTSTPDDGSLAVDSTAEQLYFRSGSNWIAAGAGREILTAGRTYFVDVALGDDANDGLSAGAGNAFQTIQKAIDVWHYEIDASGHSVVIQLADGTYPEEIQIPPSTTGSIAIVGNNGTPANVIIDSGTAGCFSRIETATNTRGYVRITLQGMTLRPSTAAFATPVSVAGPARLYVANLVLDRIGSTSDGIRIEEGTYLNVGAVEVASTVATCDSVFKAIGHSEIDITGTVTLSPATLTINEGVIELEVMSSLRCGNAVQSWVSNTVTGNSVLLKGNSHYEILGADNVPGDAGIARLGKSGTSLDGFVGINVATQDLTNIPVATGGNGIAIGPRSVASGNDAIAIGDAAQATNTDSLALGDGADCFAEEGISIGEGATTGLLSTHAIAIGKDAEVGIGDVEAAVNSIVLGVGSSTLGSNSIVIGVDDNLPAGANTTISIGRDQDWTDPHPGSICIGFDNDMGGTSGLNNVVVGRSLTVHGNNRNVLLGTSARTSPGGGTSESVVIGSGGSLSTCSGTRAVSIGQATTVSGDYSIGIGYETTTNDLYSVAIGRRADGQGEGAICIGHDARTLSTESISIGDFSDTVGTGAIGIGHGAIVNFTDFGIAIGYDSNIGNGALSSITIGENSSVTQAVGIAIGHDAEVQGASSLSGAVAIGDTAIASASDAIQLGTGTNSTIETLQYLTNTLANSDGIQAPTSAGAPTSTPADGSLSVDTSNDALYMRSGGAWVPAAGNGFDGEDYFKHNYNGTVATASGTDSLAIGEAAFCPAVAGVCIGRSSGADGASSSAVAIGDGSDINTAQFAVAVGHDASVNSNNGVAIGNTATTNAGTGAAVAIGFNALCAGSGDIAIGSATDAAGGSSLAVGFIAQATVADSTAIGANTNATATDATALGHDADATAASAIQLGAGINSTASTLQFRTNTIANSDGIQIPYQTTGVAPTSTPANGSLVLDHNGGTTTLYARANGAWVALVSV